MTFLYVFISVLKKCSCTRISICKRPEKHVWSRNLVTLQLFVLVSEKRCKALIFYHPEKI